LSCGASAIKKKLLAEDAHRLGTSQTKKLSAKLGDVVLVLLFLRSQSSTKVAMFNILTSDIALLKREIGEETQQA
jgi:hypothetical protein